jgi:hypothetical protein
LSLTVGTDDLNPMIQLIKSERETGEWPKKLTEVTVISLKKKLKAKKCSDHRTVSFIVHIPKDILKKD